MLIPYNLLSIIFAAMAANIGWRLGNFLWEQLDHMLHKLIRWSKKDYRMNF